MADWPRTEPFPIPGMPFLRGIVTTTGQAGHLDIRIEEEVLDSVGAPTGEWRATEDFANCRRGILTGTQTGVLALTAYRAPALSKDLAEHISFLRLSGQFERLRAMLDAERFQ